MKFKLYEVGGHVRDQLMGIPSKDIDYTVVPDSTDLPIESIFSELEKHLKEEGYTIFLSTPQCFTIRAKNPSGETFDYVLARKEIGYKEGTREPIVVAGTLMDDLSRRDFTVNAIAKGLDGEIIDPFNGIQDLKNKVLRTPIKGEITFTDDPLRLLRCLRFQVTRDLSPDIRIRIWLMWFDYEELFKVVSEERIREEIYKCFKHDTLKTLNLLNTPIYQKLKTYIFTRTNLWLKPTNEIK